MEDYKQKYEQAFERAKGLYNSVFVNNDVLEQIFPELLKENEDYDERIRKALISRFNESGELDGISYEDIRIWLEKQGEQKSSDKIKPKFKVGDIISDGFSQLTVKSVQEDCYIVTTEEIENDAHIVNWVIYFKNQDKWKLVN